jgi:hypothetical protein
VDDAGAPPALTSRVLPSTLDAKLQEIAYQKALQAQMAGGGISKKCPPSLERIVLKNTSGNIPQLVPSHQTEEFCSVPAGGADHFSFRESGSSSSSSPCQSPPESSSASESRYASSPSSDTYSVDMPFDFDDLFSGVPSSEQQLDMSWDVLQLGECHPGTNDVHTTSASFSAFSQVGYQQQQLYGSNVYGSPHSVGECVTSNTVTNIAEGSLKKRSSTPTSSTLSPPRKFNVWRHCE